MERFYKKNSFIKINFHSLLGIIGLLTPVFFLFILTILNSCKVNKIDVPHSYIFIHNLYATNDVAIITNIQILDYNSTDMLSTVNDMNSTTLAIKNQGLNNFINNRDIFPWSTNMNPISIGYGNSYSSFHNNCQDSIIMRIENSYSITEDLYKKYFYALFDPIGCGYEHIISITTNQD